MEVHRGPGVQMVEIGMMTRRNVEARFVPRARGSPLSE